MKDERFFSNNKKNNKKKFYTENTETSNTKIKMRNYLIFFGILLLIYLYVFVYSSASCNTVNKKIKTITPQHKKIKKLQKNKDKIARNSLSFKLPSKIVGETDSEALLRGYLMAHKIEGRVKKHEKFIISLTRNGVSSSEAKKIVSAFESRGVFDFRRTQPGHKFIVKMNEDGSKVYVFKYFHGSRTVLIAERTSKGFKVRKIRHSIKLIPYGIGFIIRKEFITDLIKVKESKKLALHLLTLLGDEIQNKEFVSGDMIKLIVLKKYVKRKFLGYDDILAVEINSKNKGFYRIFRFSEGGYFTEDGNSFFRRYLHRPIVGNVAPEKDSDVEGGYIFPAEGSIPVWSITEGKVIFKNWAGKMGRKVSIIDNKGTLIEYFHLSRFSRKIKKNSYISKKQVVGYTGYSGLTPNKNGVGIRITYQGKYVSINFLKSLRMAPIPTDKKDEFYKEVSYLKTLLSKIKIPSIGGINERLNIKSSYQTKTKKHKK